KWIVQRECELSGFCDCRFCDPLKFCDVGYPNLDSAYYPQFSQKEMDTCDSVKKNGEMGFDALVMIMYV
ncbi:9118_t:CDS:1, partial [Ambispora gerdemannii]